MPGSAILDPDVLVDSLLDVVDDLRGELHPAFGVRAYRVHTVRRTWSGARPGDGSMTEVETEILPQPRVRVWDQVSALHYELANCGVNALGDIMLEEVSLTYTEAELTGRPLAKNEEWLLKVSDAHGQGSTPRYYTHAKPPYVDREETIGWKLWLRKVEA